MTPSSNGAVRRILVVEDQMLVALDIGNMLKAMGCTVVGPVASLNQALILARDEDLAGAILDINLDDQMIWPVADLLVSRGVPVVFATGYATATLPARYRGHPALQKPFAPGVLAHAVDTHFKSQGNPKA